MKKIICGIFFLLIFFADTMLLGARPNPMGSAHEPKKVSIGFYLMDIHDFDFQGNSLSADFWLWWSMPKGDYKPYKSNEVYKSRDTKVRHVFREDIGNGMERAEAKFSTKLSKSWDVKNFPFDKQTIEFIIEDANLPIEDLVLVPDYENSGYSKNLKMIYDWEISSLKIVPFTMEYTTNFGDVLKPMKTEYSAVKFIVEIQRGSLYLFFTYFISFFLAIVLVCLTYAIEVDDLEVRTGMILSAVFSATGGKYLLDAYIPVVSDLTFFDKIQILTFVSITIAVVFSVIIARAAKYNRELANKIDNIVGVVITAITFLLTAYFIAQANSWV